MTDATDERADATAERLVNGPEVRTLRESLGLSQLQLSGLIERWLHGRDGDGEVRGCHRWQRYRLLEPGFSPSLVRKLEKSGRASKPRVNALLDFLHERYGVDRAQLQRPDASTDHSSTNSATAVPRLDLKPRQLPVPPSDFVGRKAEREKLLAAIDAGATVIGIFGLGGVGKSALAAVVCEAVAERFPDGQVHVIMRHGDGIDSTDAGVNARHHVVLSFLPTVAIAAGESQLTGMYRTVLRKHRALLLFDDVYDADQLLSLLPPPNCLLVFTSRLQFAVPGLRWIRLGPLEQQDAREMMVTVAGRIECADALAELCGGLPLALRLVANRLAVSPQLRPEALLSAWQVTDDRAQLVDVIVQQTLHDLTLELRTAWSELAVFRGQFDEAAAAEVWQVSATSAATNLDLLYRHGLVEWRELDARYYLHNLVRLVAVRQLADAGPRQRHAKHFVRSLAFLEQQYASGDERRALAAFDRLRENLAEATSWLAPALHSQDRAAAEALAPLWYPAVKRWNIIRTRLSIDERISVWRNALTAATLLNDRVGEAVTLNTLGAVYREAGDRVSAITLHLRMLSIARDLARRDLEATALGALARTCNKTGRPRRAVTLAQAALNRTAEHSDTSLRISLLDELGVAFAYLNRVADSRRCFDEKLVLAENNGDRLNQAWTLIHLSVLDGDAGDFATAVARCETAAAISRRVGDQRVEAYALGNQGITHRQAGQLDAALSRLNDAVAIGEVFHDAWLDGNLRFARAQVCDDLGLLDDARRDLDAALQLGDRLAPGLAEKARDLAKQLDAKSQRSASDGDNRSSTLDGNVS